MGERTDKFVFTDIILVDIVGFSKLGNKKQYDLVASFNKLNKKTIKLITGGKSMVLDFIPTGDGFYILLEPEYQGKGLLLSLSLKNMARKFKRDIPYFEGIRIAVHSGYLIKVEDIRGNTNYLGDGLNQCARYLNYRIYPDHPFYDEGGFMIVSESHLSSFAKKHEGNQAIQNALKLLGFQRSQKIEFKDKHGFTHVGFLVKTIKDDVIVLDKQMTKKKRVEIASTIGEYDAQVMHSRGKLKEYEEKLAIFQREFLDAEKIYRETKEQVDTLTENIRALDLLEIEDPKQSPEIKKQRNVYRLALQNAKTALVTAEPRYKQYQEKEQETLQLLQSLIKRENEIIIKRHKKLQQDRKQLERGL